MLRALIWDVDGTVAETEHDGHRVAFNRCFEEWGLPWHWDEARYRELLHVTGGAERLLADMATRSDAPTQVQDRQTLAKALHQRKNVVYAELIRGGAVHARPGVLRLMREAFEAGLPQAIATTTSRVNIDTLFGSLLGPGWRAWFPVVLGGEDVQRKKPDPEVYHAALTALGLPAYQTMAFEDSVPGLAAATGAGIPTVLTRSRYFADVPGEGAVLACADLDHAPQGDGPITLDSLRAMHAEYAAAKPTAHRA